MRKIQTPRRIDHVNILKFITVNTETNNIIVQFTPLCQYLFAREGRNFFPTAFEKLLIKETNKLKGYVINEVALARICDYIDDLSAYLTVEKRKTRVGDLSAEMSRFQSSRPEEYEMVKKRYQRDLEIARTKNVKVYERMLAKYKRRFGDDFE